MHPRGLKKAKNPTNPLEEAGQKIPERKPGHRHTKNPHQESTPGTHSKNPRQEPTLGTQARNPGQEPRPKKLKPKSQASNPSQQTRPQAARREGKRHDESRAGPVPPICWTKPDKSARRETKPTPNRVSPQPSSNELAPAAGRATEKPPYQRELHRPWPAPIGSEILEGTWGHPGNLGPTARELGATRGTWGQPWNLGPTENPNTPQKKGDVVTFFGLEMRQSAHPPEPFGSPFGGVAPAGGAVRRDCLAPFEKMP